MSGPVKNRWPSKNTLALIKGGYAKLHEQLTNLFGSERMAARMIGRTFMKPGETEDDSFEEPRR